MGPNIKDEEAQEKQTQTEKEGEAPPQPGLSDPGTPVLSTVSPPAPGSPPPGPWGPPLPGGRGLGAVRAIQGVGERVIILQ